MEKLDVSVQTGIFPSNSTDTMDTNITRNSTPLCNQTFDELVHELKGDLEIIFMTVHISLCVLSFLVSLINIVVLTRPTMRSNTLNILLLALEISNLFFALFYFPVCVIRLAAPELLVSEGYTRMTPYIFIPASSCVMFNVWITVVTGAWRFTVVTWPLKSAQLLTRNRALVIIGVLSCVCFISALASNCLLTRTQETTFTLCADSYRNSTIELMVYRTGVSAIVVANPKITMYVSLLLASFFFLIPSILLVFLNTSLIWSICASRYRGNQLREGQTSTKSVASVKTTVILIVLLTAFLFGNVSAYLTDLAEYFSGHNPFKYPWYYIFNTFLFGFVINTLSLIGYYFMGTRFRAASHAILGIKPQRMRRGSVITLPSRVSRYDSTTVPPVGRNYSQSPVTFLNVPL